MTQQVGTLYLCPTPIGNLDDITVRVLETLKSVDLVAAEDTRRSLQLLNHFGIKKPMTSYFEHNKRQRGMEILAHLQKGESVALVTDAGMPAISDPGEDLVKLCIEQQVPIVPLPGPNAALTALIASGLPTGRFSFQGFLSMNKKNRREHLNAVSHYTDTLIFYEAPHKLKSTLQDLLDCLGNRNIVLCRELTKKFEEFVRLDLQHAIAYYEEHAPKGEFVLIVQGAAQEETSSVCELPLEEIYQNYLDMDLHKV
ncbi:MAG: 16S rRNA (cytidine(1402)-2'-O)-methyltransferase, partial [Clostridia bacterium]|nr:16S rRNA (cytidine(1402)-2'-O)-methyltransferase [Clostridia bacterium]